MRAIPCLYQPGRCFYTRLKALTWVANDAVAPSVVQANSLLAFSQLMAQEPIELPIVLNCHGVTTVAGISPEAANDIRRAHERRRSPLLLLNARHLSLMLEPVLGRWQSELTRADDVLHIYGSTQLRGPELWHLVDDAVLCEQEYIRKSVKESFEPFLDGDRRLASTPILASGILNARLLISDPARFIWISLSMAQKLDQLYQDQRPRDPCLLAVSLRGSALAAAIKILAVDDIPLVVVDHMGPKHKILEEHSLGVSTHRFNYILVADFVVGGTEMKIAQAYANLRGCTLIHTIAIGCLLHPQDYASPAGITTLVQIRECCPEARFSLLGGEVRQ